MSLKNLSAKIKIPKLLKINLDNKRVKNIYNNFEKSLMINQKFAVAVSGGPDSLSLAFLAKIYSIKNKISSKFYIVDHKLRPESTNEANFIKKILKKFHIDSKILTWKGIKPIKNIQSISRKNRYSLIFNQCDKLNINNILLGHHQDDLFENFFIRLLRGSGLKGLISLDKKVKIGNKNLLRPLLNQKKDDLEYLSKRVFNHFIKDPSNENEKYQRVKVRKLINQLKQEGLDEKKFLKTLQNLKYSNSIVEFYVKKNIKNNVFFSKNNKVILNKNFFTQPYEIVFRSLTKVINLVGKNHYPVRGKKIDRILYYIDKNRSIKATLGSCIIKKVNQTVIISKEHKK